MATAGRPSLSDAVDILARHGLIMVPADHLAALREQAAAPPVDSLEHDLRAMTGRRC